MQRRLTIASAQTTPLTQGLVAYWNFEQTSGQLLDLVKGAHNGTNNNILSGVSGIIQEAYDFSGASNSYVIVPYHQDFDFLTNSLSIVGWFNPDDVSATQRVMLGTYDGSGLGATIAIEIGVVPNKASITIRDIGENGFNSIPSSSTFGTGNWLHTALIINRAEQKAKLYINGILEIDQDISNVGILTTGNPIYIGEAGYTPSPNFDGRIDELGIWNRSLSQTEILALYNNGNGIPYGTLPPPIPIPPILSPIGNQSTQENQTLTIQLNATDPNVGENLTFLTNAQSILPSQSFLNSTSGLFTWTPTYNDQGFYNVTFYVTDGQFVDYETVQITVQDVSFATISAPSTAQLGNTTTFNLHDPLNPNTPYIFSLSFSSIPGIPLPDGRAIPLTDSWLLQALLFVPQLFGFSNSIGTLDSQGNAQVTWNVPNIPGANGMTLYGSFVTLNYSAQGNNLIPSIAPAINFTLTNNNTSPSNQTGGGSNNTNATWPLVALWHFDENSGTTTADASGNGNTGALENGVAWTNESILGNALHFDGIDDRLSTIHTQSIDLTHNISIEAWVKRVSNANGTIVSRNGPFYLAIYDNKIRGGIYTNDWTEISGTTDLQIGAWYKLKMQKDSQTLKVFVNDIEENSISIIGQMPIISQNLFIGWGEPGQNYHFHGTIDEITIIGI